MASHLTIDVPAFKRSPRRTVIESVSISSMEKDQRREPIGQPETVEEYKALVRTLEHQLKQKPTVVYFCCCKRLTC